MDPQTSQGSAQPPAGVVFDQNPLQQPMTVNAPSSAPPAGVTFDSTPLQQPMTVNNGQQTQQQQQPGFMERMYEGSGLKGAVDLAKQSLVYSATRPIDIYHQALDAAQKGDWKGATEAAYRLTNMGLEPENPLVQAAGNMLTSQFQQAQKQHDTFQKDRAAGHGVASSFVDSATNGAASRAAHDLHSGHAAAVPADVLSGAVDSGVAGPTGSMISAPVHNLETDARAGNESGMLGDMLGGAAAAGSLLVPGGEAGEAGEGAEAADAGGGGASSVRPTTTKVAGVDIPTAASNPRLPGGMSRAGKIAKTFATPEGAKNFVADHVQPAAVQATQANFAQSAVNTANELREVRGEGPLPSSGIGPDGKPISSIAPTLTDPDDVANMLRGEAKKTYTKLDQAAEKDINDWTEKYGKAAQEAEKPAPKGFLGQMQDAKPAPKPVEIPPKPKTFTELQDQITDAENKLDPTNTVSQVDRQWAKDNLPKFQNERDAFLAQHKDVVSPDELNAADNTWRSSRQYDWIAKKVRTARTDSGAGAVTKAEVPTFRIQSLRNLPKNFDNQFGKGSWDDLLGPQGSKNYNDVVNLLATPKVGGSLMDAAKEAPWLGKAVNAAGKVPLSPGWVANKLLFDPEFGQGAIAQLRKVSSDAIKTGAKAAARPVAVAGQVPSQADTTKRRVMNGVQNALSGVQ